jgi:preprotein translocase subunit SecA
VLSVLDRKWREHLYEMDYLREGIGLRAMAQRDPLVEYQREGYDMFNAMMDGIKEESVGNLFNLEVQVQENPIVEEAQDTAEATQGAVPGMLFGPPAAGGVGAPGGPANAGAQGAPAPAEAAGQAVPAGLGRPAATTGRHASQPGAASADQAPAQLGRRRGKHAADGRGHATAAGRGQAAAHSGSKPHGGSQGHGGSHAHGGGQETIDDQAHDLGSPADQGAQLPSALEPHRPRHLQYSAPSDNGGVEHRGDASAEPFAGVGRNDPCPCGSGRKFKRCHGDPRNAAS